MGIYDVFISYSSKDRPWAMKCWQDLRASYPALQIFWDRDSIPAGVEWRPTLRTAIRDSKHLLVFWSDYAKASTETVDEIATFRANREKTPQLERSDRKLFYVPLEGDWGGGITDVQGFPDFRTVYKSVPDNRGIDGVASGEGSDQWKRMIRMIGDAAARADPAHEIVAAIAAVDQNHVEYLDQIQKVQVPGTSVTLEQFLAGFKLDWVDVRTRYGVSGFAWKPVGDRTIVDLLEDVRVRVNADLDPADHFRWRYVDLMSAEGCREIATLHKKASIVIFDPISLYDQWCANAMRQLTRYVRTQQSVILSLSPALSGDEDVYAACVRGLSLPLFNDYFQPEIPPAGEFLARCLPEVRREAQIDRLVRSRIRDLHIASEEDASKGTTRPR